jgi:hypothetical protein
MKKSLRQIIKNDGDIPKNVDIYSFSLELLDLMGDVDPELRDELAGTILYNWIVENKLTDGQVKHLTVKALDQNHLQYGIGTVDDRVFMRTFSVLVVAAALKRHCLEAFLSQEEIINICDNVLAFYHDDVDVRGFLVDKGWAHGAAHGADALMYLCKIDEVDESKIQDILDVIKDKATIDYYGYVHEEYERMNNAVFAVIETGRLTEDYIIKWISQFGEITLSDNYPEKIIQRSNINHFVRSLYFRVYNEPDYQRISQALITVIDRCNPYG